MSVATTAGSVVSAGEVQGLAEGHVGSHPVVPVQRADAGRRGSNPEVRRSRSARTVARSPASSASDAPARSGSDDPRARARSASWNALAGAPRRSGLPIHEVVVDQRHRVQQLERGGGSLDRPVVDTARRAVAPEAEHRTQPLAPRHGQPDHLVDREQRVRARRPPSPRGRRSRKRSSVSSMRARTARSSGGACAVRSADMASVSQAPLRSSVAIMSRARPDSMNRFQKLALATAAATIVLFAVGGLVRGTGSGLGCSTWPECTPGRLFPAGTVHSLIEFSHRFLVFVVYGAGRRDGRRGVAAVPATSRRSCGRPWPRSRWCFGQAVLGGIVVHTDLNPWWVTAHFAVALAFVADVIYVATNSFCVVRLPERRDPTTGRRRCVRAAHADHHRRRRCAAAGRHVRSRASRPGWRSRIGR